MFFSVLVEYFVLLMVMIFIVGDRLVLNVGLFYSMLLMELFLFIDMFSE